MLKPKTLNIPPLKISRNQQTKNTRNQPTKKNMSLEINGDEIKRQG
jgi:hypothetical protein